MDSLGEVLRHLLGFLLAVWDDAGAFTLEISTLYGESFT